MQYLIDLLWYDPTPALTVPSNLSSHIDCNPGPLLDHPQVLLCIWLSTGSISGFPSSLRPQLKGGAHLNFQSQFVFINLTSEKE